MTSIVIDIPDIVDVSEVMWKDDWLLLSRSYGFTVYLKNDRTYKTQYATYATEFEAVATREALVGRWHAWVKTKNEQAD